ncbi:MAG: hypothetical protein IOD12_09940 [Silvanigrellales bacterium]|nr:hypothetical protein [Silvanigrellales bacterium]
MAFLSTAFSVLNDEGWTVRLGGSASDVVFQKKRPSTLEHAPWSATTQLLVTF